MMPGMELGSAASVRDVLRPRLHALVEGLPPGRRLRMKLVSDRLEHFAAGRQELTVLDAGCEGGLLTTQLALDHPHWSVVGIDLKAAAVAQARRRAQRERATNVIIEQGDLTSDLGSERYDAIVASECLAEIPDDDTALRRLSTALKPTGLIVIHVPVSDWRPVLASSPTTWKGMVRDGYDPVDLAAKLEAAGLRVVKDTPTTRGTVHLAQELRERIKERSLKLQAAVVPVTSAAVWLERHGITWGSPRALLVEATRR